MALASSLQVSSVTDESKDLKYVGRIVTLMPYSLPVMCCPLRSDGHLSYPLWTGTLCRDYLIFLSQIGFEVVHEMSLLECTSGPVLPYGIISCGETSCGIVSYRITSSVVRDTLLCDECKGQSTRWSTKR